MSESAQSYERVLWFWFGAADDNGRAPGRYAARWWKKDLAFDEDIRAEFLADHQDIMAGRCENWLATARGRLAYLIVLDQFSRNMFRDQAAMFACDVRALRVALDGIATGADRELAGDLRAFFYLPLMHSEELAMQDHCVELFAEFRTELSGDMRDHIDANLDAAVKHRNIVARWQRFPHRNAILGRDSTPAEVDFLTQPGSSF